MAEEQNFIRKFVFRFVSKHIAGATLNSALNVTKDLNSKGIGTTITFLNDHVSDSMKARYNLNSYVQLTKQISRLNLDASVSLRLSQLGFALSESTADHNMLKLVEVASSLGIPIWMEMEDSLGIPKMMRIYSKYLRSYPDIGIEMSVRSESIGNAISRLPKGKCMVKLTSRPACSSKERRGKPRQKQKQESVASLYERYAREIGSGRRLFIQEGDEKALFNMASKPVPSKRDLIVELPLGYNRKWLNRLAKKKLSIGVYVPYGKDWVPYAISRMTEGRIRNIATSILNGESEVGLDGRREKR